MRKNSLLVILSLFGLLCPSVTAVGDKDASKLKNGVFDGIDLVRLADPSTFALQVKDEWTLTEIADSPKFDHALKLSVDAIAGYRYHPKLHANAGLAYEVSRLSYKIPLPAFREFNNEKLIYPIRLSAGAAFESAPVAPTIGDATNWQSANTNASIGVISVVPYTDLLPEKLGEFLKRSGLGGDQAMGGLYVDLKGAYLDQRSEKPEKPNGFRGTASFGYALPMPFNSELLGLYEYSWGNALASDKHYYAIQLSRYFGDGYLSRLLEKITGAKDTPRLFVRYYEGGVAPTFARSRGWEFGIGKTSVR